MNYRRNRYTEGATASGIVSAEDGYGYTFYKGPSKKIADYVKYIPKASTARHKADVLRDFEKFVFQIYAGKGVDALVKEIKADQKKRLRRISEEKDDDYDEDDDIEMVYRVLSDYGRKYLTPKHARGLLRGITIRQRVRAAKEFLEAKNVDIHDRKWKVQVLNFLPKKEGRLGKEDSGMTKPQVTEILRAIANSGYPRLSAFVFFLAVLGWRPREAISLRHQDFDFESTPASVTVQAQLTKMNQLRKVYLTRELTAQLKLWLVQKHRPRRVAAYERDSFGRPIAGGKRTEYILQPKERPNDYFFAPYHADGTTVDDHQLRPSYMYGTLREEFIEVLKNNGLIKQIAKGKAHNVTLYSFRRFAYTTIDGLGMRSFAEYWIGHANSEYWDKPKELKIKETAKVEPYLTFLDYKALETRSADMESRLLEKDVQINDLKMKYSEMSLKYDLLIRGKIESLALGQGIDQGVYIPDDEPPSSKKVRKRRDSSSEAPPHTGGAEQ